MTIIGILLIPFVAMQFTSEVDWSLFDFIVAALLLFGVGIMIDIVARRTKGSKYRPIYLALILIFFVLIWAELAVGILGSPFAGS